MPITARQSQYLDGTIPGMRNPRVFISEEGLYIQPDIQIAAMGEGSKIEDGKKSICQPRDSKMNFGIADWLRRNRNTIIIGLAIYGGYRILKR